MRISDWSSDVCSSDLGRAGLVHLNERAREDLPRNAEAVLQPPARAGLAPIGQQSVPIMVYFRLILAIDRHGDRLGKGELRPAVQPNERPDRKSKSLKSSH